MSNDIPDDVLKLTYEEARSRFEYRLEEWKAMRSIALRTFTGILVLISVMIAVVSTFQNPINQFMSQPVDSIWDWIGAIVGPTGILLLALSPLGPLYALWHIPDSLTTEFEPVGSVGTLSTDVNKTVVITSEQVADPQSSQEEWYKVAISEYEAVLKQTQLKSPTFIDPSKMIQMSQMLAGGGVLLIALGLWMATL